MNGQENWPHICGAQRPFEKALTVGVAEAMDSDPLSSIPKICVPKQDRLRKALPSSASDLPGTMIALLVISGRALAWHCHY